MLLILGMAGQQSKEHYPLLHEYHIYINVRSVAAHVIHSD